MLQWYVTILLVSLHIAWTPNWIAPNNSYYCVVCLSVCFCILHCIFQYDFDLSSICLPQFWKCVLFVEAPFKYTIFIQWENIQYALYFSFNFWNLAHHSIELKMTDFFFLSIFFLYFPFGQVAWNNTTSVKVMVVITVTYRYLIHTILKSKTVRHYFLSFFIVDNVDVWNFYLFVRLW